MKEILSFDEWLEYQDGERELDELIEEYLEYLERLERRERRGNNRRLEYRKRRR
jgi:hypothetical protein